MCRALSDVSGWLRLVWARRSEMRDVARRAREAVAHPLFWVAVVVFGLGVFIVVNEHPGGIDLRPQYTLQ